MSFWSKSDRPVDRAVQELDQQIAAVERQIRRLEPQGAAIASPPPASPAYSLTKLFKDIIAPPKRERSQPGRDQFDAGAEPLKDLENTPIAFLRKTEPDLFAHAAQPASNERKAEDDSRLMRYLSAGSIRTYKPLKSVQRRQRNRFFMWLGLSFAALWVIYVIVR